MKKIILGVASLMIIGASCSKQEQLSNDNNSNNHYQALSKGSQRPIELLSVNLDGSVDYNNLTLEQAVEFHNEAMEYIATQIESSNVCPADEQTFKNQLESYLETFLATKGIVSDFKVNSIANGIQFDQYLLNDPANNLSTLGNQLCVQIEQVFSDYTESNLTQSEFSNAINQIVQDANSINDLSERKAVQLTAKICEGSTLFWEDKLPELKSKIMSGCNSQNPNAQQRANVPWGSVAYADASGAITWGRVGFFAAGGPAGAVACGLAGAAGHSALRLVTFGIFGS